MKTSAEPTRHRADLRSLRIERTPVPPRHNRNKRLMLVGAAVVIVCEIAAIAQRAVVRPMPVVETTRAMRVTSPSSVTALSATGYIVAHHKIDVNSKVTGRVKWIGVEKCPRTLSESSIV